MTRGLIEGSWSDIEWRYMWIQTTQVDIFWTWSNKDRWNEEKVAPIRQADPPHYVSEAISFLGLAQSVSTFVPHPSSIAEPIQWLTHMNFEFKRAGNKQQVAFEKLKELITHADALTYCNVKSRTRILADTSPVGLRAVLTQLHCSEWRVIGYATRRLSDVERWYSQTEKEALAL